MNPKKTIRPEHKKQHAKNTIRSIKRHWQLYLIVALPLVYLIVFKYMRSEEHTSELQSL